MFGREEVEAFYNHHFYGLTFRNTKQSDADFLEFSKLNNSFGESRGIKGMKVREDVRIFAVKGVEAFMTTTRNETKQSGESQFELGFVIIDDSVITGI